MAEDVLTGQARVGKKVLVVGGGIAALETAQFLSEKGKSVTLIARSELGRDIYPILRPAVIQKTREAGVVIYTSAVPEQISARGVSVNIAGRVSLFKVDSVVLAIGREADSRLEERLEGKVSEVHVIGDCASPRIIRDAIYEGHRVGRSI